MLLFFSVVIAVGGGLTPCMLYQFGFYHLKVSRPWTPNLNSSCTDGIVSDSVTIGFHFYQLPSLRIKMNIFFLEGKWIWLLIFFEFLPSFGAELTKFFGIEIRSNSLNVKIVKLSLLFHRVFGEVCDNVMIFLPFVCSSLNASTIGRGTGKINLFIDGC